MTSSAPTLLDIGSSAFAHQSAVDEVKRRLNITHGYFDCWIYGFLENKNFDVDLAIAKLHRRDEFEKTDLAEAEVTQWMVENMQKGIIQVIGNDKQNRVVFYVTTHRDKPQASRRDESRRCFDMFVSYGTRLRPESKRCQMVMLINQEKASMWSNLDMTFQADIALRIAKYYPGCIDKMYICKMGRTLATLAKPIFSRLPSIVSDRIQIIDDGDIKRGKLLDLIDESVLPVALGGKNDCDRQENYTRFAFTIRDYFEGLKRAIHLGKSVKEWELDNLREAGYASSSQLDLLPSSLPDAAATLDAAICTPRTRDVSPGNRSWSAASMGDKEDTAAREPQYELTGIRGNGDETGAEDDLYTCDTVHGLDVGLATHDTALQAVYARYNTLLAEPRNLFADYVAQFMTIETFFRLNLVEMHRQDWLRLLKQELKERQQIDAAEEFQSDMLLHHLPPILYIVGKGFLWMCLMVMSLYFLLATLFIALLGTTTLVYLFFAMFSTPYAAFTYGVAFLVTAGQFVVCCSRGYDMTRNTYNCRAIQALRAFGGKALLCQLAVNVLCVLGYFVVFCVMAAREGALAGFQYSIAVGWIVSACLIGLYHFLFAFGFRSINKTSYAHGSRVNNAETTLYLFMNVEFDEEQLGSRSAAEAIIPFLLATLSFGAGVAFLSGGGLFFLCAAIVVQIILLLLIAVLMSINNATSSSSVVVCGVFYASLFWMDVVFTMSRHGWEGGWGNSVLAMLFVMLFFLVVGFAGVYGPWKGRVRSWLLRVTWLLIIAYFAACVIVLLVQNYRMGLFVFALGTHLLVSNFRTNEASNNYGMFTIALGFMAALLACCLVGKHSFDERYAYSVSETLLPDYGVNHLLASAGASRELSAAQYSTGNRGSEPPLCLSEYPAAPLNIVAMSLFAKLGYNTNATAQRLDLARWLPGFDVVAASLEEQWELLDATVFRATGETPVKTTVIAVRPGPNVQAMIEAMTMWIDVYTISFFGALMPERYHYRVAQLLSFARSMTPLLWRNSFAAATELVRSYLANEMFKDDAIYIVGHGPTGTAATLISGQVSTTVRSVVFSPVQVLYTTLYDGLNEEQLARRTVFVQSGASIFNPWYSSGAYSQLIPCHAGGIVCDHIDNTVKELDLLCD